MAKKATARKTLDPNLPIFQLKITLEEIEPAIWRRIQTPDCSLADLHEIIQFCMEWDDDHLHAFAIGEAQYTDLGRGGDAYDFRDSRSLWLSSLVKQGRYRFDYEYDFGDSWRHAIEIESTLPPEESLRYPRSLDGQRASPPEDCGGAWGYCDLLEAREDPDRGEDDESDWLDEDFDPEMFDVEVMNRRFSRLRRYIGRKPGPHGPTARFAVGDRVRVRPGAAHSEYPDIPLGGWVGTVRKIAWLIPISYEILWSEPTLAAAHPVYAKRCRRDDIKPDVHWLDEGELELDSAEQPVEMKQPAELVVKPLSADDQDDCVRMAFGLTSDDPLPAVDNETQQQYLAFLKSHLSFPFSASYWPEATPNSPAAKPATIVGLASPSPIDLVRGVLCEAHCGDAVEQVPLVDLELEEDDPNWQYVDDYAYWRHEVQEFASYGEADGEYWDDEDEFEEDEDAEEDADFSQNAFGPILARDFAGISPAPQPIRRENPPVGRNDPCPCGSGKKFKKCCLKKQGDQSAE